MFGFFVYEGILQMASKNGLSFNRKGKDSLFANGLTLSYDPADSRNDPSCPTEFIYIRRGKLEVAEGVVNLDEGKACCRIDKKEIMLHDHKVLAGFMLSILFQWEL